MYEPVFKAIQQFRSGKKGSDDLFDKLDTSKLNAHLKELMPGLTAKVFRTYNASFTLEQQVSCFQRLDVFFLTTVLPVTKLLVNRS